MIVSASAKARKPSLILGSAGASSLLLTGVLMVFQVWGRHQESICQNIAGGISFSVD